MNANPKLRKWLNHKPRPVVVEADEHRLDAPNTDRGWAEVAETLEQLSPSRVVLRDANGKVLRAKPWEYFFPRDSTEVEQPAAFVPQTPEQASLAQFASLLADAHKSPTMVHALELIDRQAAQNTRLEQEASRLREQLARVRAELAEARAELQLPPPEGNDLVGGLMQGIAAAAQAAEVTPISKGKKS